MVNLPYGLLVYNVLVITHTHHASIPLHLYSLVVKVYRRCMARREWTSVDFSGCTLESDDQQVIVIVSLWAIISSNNDESQEQIDIMSLKEQV